LYPDFSKPICYRNQYQRVVEECLPSAKFRKNLIKVIDYSIAKKYIHQQNRNCVAPCGGFGIFLLLWYHGLTPVAKYVSPPAGAIYSGTPDLFRAEGRAAGDTFLATGARGCPANPKLSSRGDLIL
jgi:hypothetical protein